MARYYDEEVGDHNERKNSSKMSKAEKLLNREFWRGQLHGGDTGNGPVHARHMRSRCSVIPMGKFIQFCIRMREILIFKFRHSVWVIQSDKLHTRRRSVATSSTGIIGTESIQELCHIC
jgi:hypothetical protein